MVYQLGWNFFFFGGGDCNSKKAWTDIQKFPRLTYLFMTLLCPANPFNVHGGYLLTQYLQGVRVWGDSLHGADIAVFVCTCMHARMCMRTCVCVCGGGGAGGRGGNKVRMLCTDLTSFSCSLWLGKCVDFLSSSHFYTHVRLCSTKNCSIWNQKPFCFFFFFLLLSQKLFFFLPIALEYIALCATKFVLVLHMIKWLWFASMWPSQHNRTKFARSLTRFAGNYALP